MSACWDEIVHDNQVSILWSLHITEWLCCGNSGLWFTVGSCNACTTFSSSKLEATRTLEVALDWICRLLWSFWFIYKAQVVKNVNFVKLKAHIMHLHFLSKKKEEYNALTFMVTLNFFHPFCFLLRYLLHVMNVATPTKDCLELVNELLVPILKARSEKSLTRQEVRLPIAFISLLKISSFIVFASYWPRGDSIFPYLCDPQLARLMIILNIWTGSLAEKHVIRLWNTNWESLGKGFWEL